MLAILLAACGSPAPRSGAPITGVTGVTGVTGGTGVTADGGASDGAVDAGSGSGDVALLQGQPADPRVTRVLLDGEPTQLNPDLDPDSWAFRIAEESIYEPLLRRRRTPGTADPAGEAPADTSADAWEPVLADRITVEDEGRRVVFHLRPGVTFHDGKPLTSSDVLFTFDKLRMAKTKAPRMQWILGALGDLERIDLAVGGNVRFTAQRPTRWLLPAIAEVGILPEHLYARGDMSYNPANRRPVGSGPLKLMEWDRGRRIVLGRNGSYWGAPAAGETVEILFDTDAVHALGRAKRGEVDVLGRVPAAYVPEQLDSPSLRARFETVRTHPSRFTFVLWNLLHAPLDDRDVRRAFATAVDRQRVLEEARHGLGRRLDTAPPHPPLAPEAEMPSNVADPGSTRAATAETIAAANAALDAAGLLRSGNGARLRSGRPIKLTLLVPNGSREGEVAARRVSDTLAKLGVGVDLVQGDLSLILLRLRHGAFDGVLLEWSGLDGDDLAPLFRTRGRDNYGGFSSREVDSILDEMRRPPSPGLSPGADRILRDRQRAHLSELLDHEAPALFLYAPDEVYLYSRRLRPLDPLPDFPLLRNVGPR